MSAYGATPTLRFRAYLPHGAAQKHHAQKRRKIFLLPAFPILPMASCAICSLSEAHVARGRCHSRRLRRLLTAAIAIGRGQHFSGFPAPVDAFTMIFKAYLHTIVTFTAFMVDRKHRTGARRRRQPPTASRRLLLPPTPRRHSAAYANIILFLNIRSSSPAPVPYITLAAPVVMRASFASGAKARKIAPTWAHFPHALLLRDCHRCAN